MTPLLRAGLVALSVLGAPLQCSREPEADERNYETPPEALHVLAERFKKEGNEQAWRETLAYLVERYPNSRFAARARAELEGE